MTEDEHRLLLETAKAVYSFGMNGIGMISGKPLLEAIKACDPEFELMPYTIEKKPRKGVLW